MAATGARTALCVVQRHALQATARGVVATVRLVGPRRVLSRFQSQPLAHRTFRPCQRWRGLSTKAGVGSGKTGADSTPGAGTKTDELVADSFDSSVSDGSNMSSGGDGGASDTGKGNERAGAGGGTGEGKDGSSGGGEGEEEKPEDEEFAGNKWWFMGFGVLGLVAGPYALLNMLRDDEDMRDEWTEDYPQVMEFIRTYSPQPVDPPAPEEPIIRYETEAPIKILLFTSKGRLFATDVAADVREPALRALFKAAQSGSGDAVLASLDGKGPPGEDEKLIEIAFAEDGGRVPRPLREPTEKEIVKALRALRGQLKWAVEEKAKYWWWTENRSVMQQYEDMLTAQIGDAVTKLQYVRNMVASEAGQRAAAAAAAAGVVMFEAAEESDADVVAVKPPGELDGAGSGPAPGSITAAAAGASSSAGVARVVSSA